MWWNVRRNMCALQRYDSTINHPTVGCIIIKANALLQKKKFHSKVQKVLKFVQQQDIFGLSHSADKQQEVRA